ncbi:MAG: leucine-rich repeat domain-containing protein [Prevotella sp.]|nr:leucine-rich repeat domain-containing protein [Prevotella sp.]
MKYNGTQYSVTSIGKSAFSDCSGLTSVTIPNSVTSIGKYAFSDCSGLTEINVDENNTVYSSIDGVVFNKSQTELVCYPGGKQGAYIIPNSVTSIGEYAFDYCSGLTSVTIGNSVTSIGKYAFWGCTGLTSVTIPNSVTSIGESAFDDCTGLTSVTIGNSVTSIGNWAFYRCSGLTSIDIPNSVTSIGECAFFRCSGLTDIYCHIEEPLTIDSSVFNYVPTNTCTLHVPIGSKVKYEAADVWKSFLNIVEDLPTGIVSIDNSQLTIDNDVWFTLNGVRLNGKPTRNGVYLVKYNNGNIRKVMIK